jgi:serum/glucocorticoid-regulated kinase 2
MPGAVQLPQEQQQQSPGSSSKKKFGTVRGIGAAIKDSSGTLSNQISHSWIVGREALPLNRRSRDTPPRYSRRRKHRVQQSSATDVEFFETTAPGSHNADSFEPFIVVENMKRFDPSQPRYNRRPPVRMDNQDGPWSVSVAETPHDPQSYSLYVKSASDGAFLVELTSHFPCSPDAQPHSDPNSARDHRAPSEVP